MKKTLGYFGIALLSGMCTLGGYKLFFEQPIVIERTTDNPVQTIPTSYTPAFSETTTSSYAPSDFTEAVDKTIDAVVHVKNTAVKSGITSLQDLFNGPRKYEQVGTGSGVIISSDGYIVTNNHVIAGATDLEITLNNRKKYKAELIGTDEKNDIALLKIDTGVQLPYVPFANSDQIKIGEWVLAVGNPYNLNSTVTAGIISATGRDLEGNASVDDFIQTDAAVNPGNSGGALVNTRGELIGINTAISSRTGSYIGYSFAVPSNIAKKIIDDILEFGAVQEAILGINVDLRDSSIEGVKIGSLPDDSEAKKAGLKQGDIIKKVNNITITKFSELSGQLTAKRPGDLVAVTVDRNGTSVTKNVKLTKRDTYVSSAFNWQLKDLSKSELKKFALKSGVKISKTASRNPSNSLENFIITKINNRAVTSASQTAKILDELGKSRYSIVIEVMNLDGEKELIRFR